MEQRLTHCTLSVIEGGTHGLLWRADVVGQIFKGIASSWKLAEFERSLSQRWSIKQLGLNINGGNSALLHHHHHQLPPHPLFNSSRHHHQSYRSSATSTSTAASTTAYTSSLQQAIQTNNIYETQALFQPAQPLVVEEADSF